MKYDINIDDVIQKFCDECQLNGLMIEPWQIKPDGEFHRCPVIESKRSKTSGSYRLFARNHNDYPFNGYIENFKTGIQLSWKYANLNKQHKSVSLKCITSNDDLNKKYLKIAYVAYQIYQKGKKYPTGINYLDLKKVKAYGVTFRDFNGEKNIVTVPARDIEGKIWTVQSIFQSGHKQFLKDGKKHGMFHKIGFVKLSPTYSGLILIAEGYATATSIFMATRAPSVCAFDAGNLLIVSKIFKSYCPNAELVICADADYKGIMSAHEVSLELNCTLVLPDFKNIKNTIFKDFNDLHCSQGLDEVANQIIKGKEIMPLIIDQAYKLLKNEILDKDIDPNYIKLAHEIIKSYYLIVEAKRISEIAYYEQQQAEINLYHTGFQKEIKDQLTKIQAKKLFFNKPIDTDSDFIYQIKTYINENLIPVEASRICRLEDLKSRQLSISKVNPEFQSALKSEILKLWQLRDLQDNEIK